MTSLPFLDIPRYGFSVVCLSFFGWNLLILFLCLQNGSRWWRRDQRFCTFEPGDAFLFEIRLFAWFYFVLRGRIHISIVIWSSGRPFYFYHVSRRLSGVGAPDSEVKRHWVFGKAPVWHHWAQNTERAAPQKLTQHDPLHEILFEQVLL